MVKMHKGDIVILKDRDTPTRALSIEATGIVAGQYRVRIKTVPGGVEVELCARYLYDILDLFLA